MAERTKSHAVGRWRRRAIDAERRIEQLLGERSVLRKTVESLKAKLSAVSSGPAK